MNEIGEMFTCECGKRQRCRAPNHQYCPRCAKTKIRERQREFQKRNYSLENRESVKEAWL